MKPIKIIAPKNEEYIIIFNRKTGQEILSGVNGNPDPFILESPARGWVNCAWNEVLGKYLPFPSSLLNYAGTQFMCHKKLILQYPKSFYADLHTWLMFTSLPDRASGRVFEYVWHYILTKNPIDKKYEINEILKFIRQVINQKFT